MLTDGDYCVRMIGLPGDIGGATRLSEGDYANVYINDQLSPQAKRRVFLHEIRHIERNDFFNGLSIEEVEAD